MLRLLSWQVPPELSAQEVLTLGYVGRVAVEAPASALSLPAEISSPQTQGASRANASLIILQEATGSLTVEPTATPQPKATRPPAGPPARVVLKAAQAGLPADGRSQTALVVWVADAQGRPVAEGTRVQLSSDNTLGRLAETGLGTHEGIAVTWLSAGRQAGQVTVTASVGEVSGQTPVRLIPPWGERINPTGAGLALPPGDLVRLGQELRYALVPVAADAFLAEDESYRALFKPSGAVEFHSKGNAVGRPPAGLSFQLSGVRLGQTVLYPAGGRGLRAEANRASYRAGLFREEYRAIAGGLEQFFIFEHPAGGRRNDSDELVIEGVFDTALVGQVVSKRAGIAFYPPEGPQSKSDPGHLIYSGARVRDGEGRETYAEISLRGNQVRLTVPGHWLAGAEYPVVVDPLIGDPTIISDPPGAAAEAALGHNSSANEYLVLWQESESGGSSDLYARRVLTDGTLIDPRLEISLAAGDQANPAVAYNSQANEYLLVWEDSRTGPPGDLYGQRLGGDGSPVGEAFVIVSATLTDGHRAPALAYNSSDNSYLLIWNSYTASSGADDLVYAQVLAATGAVSGTAEAVSEGGSEQSVPTLAYDSDNNRFLVAWQDGRNSSFDIYARLVGAAGQPLGSELLVEGQGNDQFVPKVAYTPGQYLVGWRHHVDTDTFKVRARRVTGAGVLEGASFDIIGEIYDYHAYFDLVSNGVDEYLAVWDRHYDGGEIWARRVFTDGSKATTKEITNYDNDQVYPLAVYNPDDEAYLLAWEDHRLGRQLIYGQRLEGDATKQGGNFSLSRLLVTRNDPVVAANPDDLERAYLAVWEENREGTDDIYGQWLTADGVVTGPELALSLTDGDEDDPAVAYNEAAGQYLVAWHSDHGSSGDDIYARRVDNSGPVGGVITLTTAGNYQRSPRVAANSLTGEWLVVWHDFRDNSDGQVYARRVLSDGSTTAETQIALYVNEVDVAYNPDDNEYLVVWQRYDSGDEHIEVQRFSAGGTALGTVQRITTPQAEAFDIGVSYHRAAGHYLVVWADGYANTIIHGQRVLAEGTLASGVITIYDYPGPNDGDQSHPTTVYDSGAEESLVVWRIWDDYRFLQGRRLDGTGNLVAEVETLVDVSWDLGANHPQLTYHAGLGQSMLVWQQVNNEIYAQPYAIPHANFGAEPQSGNAPFEVTFVNNSSNASTFHWNFGDGSTSTAISPTHVYTQPGVYTVTLTASEGSSSHTLTRTGYITAFDANLPYADFTAAPLVGPAPLVVTFTNRSVNADSYLWDFGDTFSSTLSHPVHTYTQPGAYSVVLTATNQNGSNSRFRTDYITPFQLQPQAAFSAAPLTGTIPLTVTFSNQSVNANSFRWDFGDGATSSDTNPTHTYLQAGVYTVTLAASDEGMTDILTRTSYIIVGTQQLELIQVGEVWRYFKGTQALPINWAMPGFGDSGWLTGPTGIGYGDGDDATVLTDMEGNYLTVFARRVFTIENPAAMSVLTLEMDYDDGFVAYLNGTAVVTENVGSRAYDAAATASREAGTVVVYDLSGSLDLLQPGQNVLAVQGHNSSLSSSDFSLIPALRAEVAFSEPAGPEAGYVGTPLNGIVPLTVTFSNSSVGASSYLWDFGDDTSGSTEINPTHIYNQTGVYTVTLSASNGGMTDILTRTNYIVVSTQQVELIQVGDVWRYFKGTQAPPANWAGPGFDDSSWPAGATGIGYGDGDDATVLSDMKGDYLTVFARKAFTIENPAAVLTLTFEMDYDDGFVAYLNGMAVVTENVSSRAYDAKATASHEAGTAVVYDLSGRLDALQAGLNVLAVQGHNSSLSSNDFSLIPALRAEMVGGAPAGPQAGFTAEPLSGAAPLTVTFTNQSTNANSFRWDFGDGTPGSSAVSPTHTYTQGGVYTVTLAASDGLVTDTLAKPNYVTVSPPVTAAFSAFPRSGPAPLIVLFFDNSTNASNYLWDFGDGLTGTVSSPAHTYTQTGLYTVSLTAGNGILTDTLTKPNYITVVEPVIADFSAAPLTGTVPLTVTFVNSSTGATSYLWDFGDGTTSTAANPGHVYIQAGSYTVTLSAGDGVTTDTLTRSNYITVTNQQIDLIQVGETWRYFRGTQAPPATWAGSGFDDGSWPAGPTGIGYGDGDDATVLSDMKGNYLTVFARKAFTIENPAAVIALTFEMDYDDGFVAYLNGTAVVTENVSSPAHDAPAPTSHEAGTPVGYDLSADLDKLQTGLNVLAVQGHNRRLSDNDFSLIPALQAEMGYIPEPQAAFRATPLSGRAPLTVTFVNNSTYADSYLWHFGDGSSGSAVISPTHIYTQAGVYTVTLAAGNGVVTDTLVKPNYITVSQPVTATFSAFPTSGPAPLAVLFFDNSTNASSYLWDFGDGLTGTVSSPVHTYTQSGVYTVSLTVAGSDGITDTLTKPRYITVTEPVVADFTASPLSGTVPLTVTFVNSSTGATGYLWDFGDGGSGSVVISPTHIYTQAGIYTVTLVAGNGLVTDTLTRTNYITAILIRDWRPITTTTSPPVVGEHAMAYDSARERVVLYGGNATGWPYENSTWEFDGTDWITITTPLTPPARYGAGLAYDSTRGTLVLFGGSDETDTALNQSWEYTDTTWVQVSISGTVPASRTYHSLAADPISGTIYLFGGNEGETYYNDLWRYENGSWSAVSPITGTVPAARSLAALAYDPDNERLLLFGGRSITGTLLADLWAFEPVSETWTELDDGGGGGGGPPGRMAHTLTYDPATGNVVLVGGATDNGDTLLGETWHYQNGWTEAAPVTPLPSQAYHQAVYTDNAIILFSNGEVWSYE